jgi:histidinol-phosphate aminotransferase
LRRLFADALAGLAIAEGMIHNVRFLRPLLARPTPLHLLAMIARNVQNLDAYTPGEQPKVPGLVKLNTNENPYPPSPRVGEALASLDWKLLSLYPDPTCMAIRETVARIHGCTAEQVFVGNGSDEILALCTRAFVEDGGGIGFFEPSYSLYPVLADIRNAVRHPVPLADGFAWADPPVQGTDLFFMTRPNAPVGIAYGKATVASFCAAFPGVVVIDEAYGDFADDDCMDLALSAENRNTLVMRTLSKSYSLAGIRCGYVVGPVELIGALYKIKDSYNLDRVTQALALAALQDRDHMLANVARIRATRARIASALRERGWKVVDSQTNFLFASPPDGDAASCFAYLRGERILVRYFPGPRTGSHLRITLGDDAQMDALLDALDRRA